MAILRFFSQSRRRHHHFSSLVIVSQRLCFESLTRFVLISCVLPIFTITLKAKKKRYTFLDVAVLFFSSGAAANVAVRDDLVSKHSSKQNKNNTEKR